MKRKFIKRQFISIFFLFTCFVVTFALCFPIYGDELEDIKNQINEKNKQIATLQSSITDLQSQANDLFSQKSNLEQNISKINSLLGSANQKSKEIDDLIGSFTALREKASQKINEYNIQKNNQLTKLYESSQENPAVLIASSSDFRDLFYSLVFNEISIRELKDQITLINLQMKDIESGLESQQIEKSIQAKQIEELNAQKRKLEDAYLAVRNNYNSVENNIVNNAAQLSILKKQYGDLSNEEKKILNSKNSGGSGRSPGSGSSNNPNTGNGSGKGYDYGGDTGTFKMIVNGNNSMNSINGPLVFVPSNYKSYFSVKGSGGSGAFTGNIEFRATTDVNFINQTSLENYVKGIAEMPSSWHMEALNAQAIAARTYALYHKGARTASGYDIDNTTAYQAYTGYVKASQQSDGSTDMNNPQKGVMYQAGQNTFGEVLYYNSSPINSFYSANNGGYELSNSVVWGGTAVPYLPSQSDPYNNHDGICSIEFYRTALPSFANWGGTDGVIKVDDSQGGLYHILGIAKYLADGNATNTVDLSAGAVSKYVNEIKGSIGNFSYADFAYNNGKKGDSKMSASKFFDTLITNSGNADYVVSLVLHGEKKQISIPSVYVEKAYNLASPLKDSFIYSGLIGSILWYFVNNNNGTVTFYEFGYGHRIGMSQCGAEGMAKKNKKFSEILSFYYPHTQLLKNKDVINNSEDKCLQIGSNYPNNDACIRVGINGYSPNDNVLTPSSNYTVYSNGNKVYSGNSNDTIEIIQN